MNYPKILLATPTSKHKDYCAGKWINYIKSLTYPNLDILIIDNSADPEYHKKFIDLGIKTLYVKPKPNEPLKDLIARSQEVIRNYVLLGGYDYWFSLESDIFSASNIIEHLLNFRKSVVGLSYFIGQACMSDMVIFELETFGYSSLSRTAHPDRAFHLFDGTCKPYYQLGLGCLLTSRYVLELVKFRTTEVHFSDVLLHADLKELGISAYLDTSNICFHSNGDWGKLLTLKR